MSIDAIKLDPDAFNKVLQIYIKHKDWITGDTALTELWNICETSEQQLLVTELFDRFINIDYDERKNIDQEIVGYLKLCKFHGNNTIIAATSDPGEVDGAIASLQDIKHKLPNEDNWSQANLMTLVKAANEIDNGWNLVIFDDFIGTGNTILRKYDYLTKILSQREIKLSSIKIVSYACMDFGYDILTKEKGLELFCPKIVKKGISGYETGALLQKKLTVIDELESKLQPKFKKLQLKKFKLGYGKSEALFSMQDKNCSNNVFPIFWWPSLKGGVPRVTCLRRLR